MIGSRREDAAHYPVSELAAKYDASVASPTDDHVEACADWRREGARDAPPARRVTSCTQPGPPRPWMNAFEAAESDEKANELHGKLLDLADSANAAADDGTQITATFLQVTANV